MAPGAKRKRGDARGYSQDSNEYNNRPSPHRPQNLGLAQQNGRRGSRSGTRGGSSTPHSPSAAHASPSAMSPPASFSQPSKSQLSTSSTVTPQNDQSSSLAITPIVPQSNEYLTQDRISAWNATARNAVVQAAITAQSDNDMLGLSIIYEELVQACLDQTLSAEEIGSMVHDIVAVASAEATTFDPVSNFLDTVSQLTEANPTHASLRPMLIATGIDPGKMRSVLESSLLIALGLVRNTFSRVAIRKATLALYRQSNYNLLREEPEGYAKLMTEYFSTVHSEPPSQQVINETIEHTNALIGAFDIDVGRVLDVTLDVFANLLVKHTRFFVKFLRSSQWWPKHGFKADVKWEEPLVSTLPRWALPESGLWYYTEEEKAEQLQLRQRRDIAFWKDMEKLKGSKAITAYFELGARRIINRPSLLEPVNETVDSAAISEKEKMQKWEEEYMSQTGTLPPSGNPDAAQLLGFKLRFYASDARDAHDTLPDNLINLAALLIKIGFIALVDLYPHLYPEYTDEYQKKLRTAKKEREEKARGKPINALAMASALPDDTLPPPAPVSRLREPESKTASKPDSVRNTPARTEEETTEKLPEPVDQKVALLRSLLCIGAIPEAMFILGRDPWLLEVYPDLRTYFFRLAHHALSKVYEWARPFSQQDILTVPKRGPSAGASPQTPARTCDYPARRTLRWAKLEEKDAGDGIDYRFYWEDWADNVPICQNVDDVFKLRDSLLAFVGLECGKDAVLLTKLARIGKKSLAEDTSKENLGRWTNLCSTFLVPALTFSGQNPGVVNEVWDLFKHFDTATRYSIYSVWFTKASTKKAVQAVFADTRAATKRLLSRISAENTKAMGRAIAKLAYACPGVVFQMALERGQTYGNMVDALIECSRYLTYLGYDCLTWTLVKSLNNGRSALQGDGMLTKPWLKNTATFIGKVYRRYSLMDPTPVLDCVAHELTSGKGNLFMLSILEQLITSMAGIAPSGALTESQVFAISAGPRLRAFTLEHYLGDRRHQAKGSAKRLTKCLTESGASQLVPTILLALAQELERYLFREELEDVPMKVLTTTFDNLYFHFAQYLDFLRSNLSVKDFDAKIPSVTQLMSVYRIEAPIAFTISRESLSAKVKAARAETKAAASISTTQRTQADGDTFMGGVEAMPASNGMNAASDEPKGSNTTEDMKMKDTTPSSDVATKDSPNAKASTAPNGVTDSSTSSRGRSNLEIEALASGLKTALPQEYGNHPCLTFFVTFWQLSLVDMFSVTSMDEYQNAQKLFTEKSKALWPDRRQEAVEKRQAIDDQIKSLGAEAQEVYAAAGATRSHLREEMHQWFDGIPMLDKGSDTRSGDLHKTLLHECFFPRARLSSADAQFASAMLKFMHKAGVPGFRTMKLLDALFKDDVLNNAITMCTPRESQNFGRFLNDILKELSSWHNSRDKYVKSAQGQEDRLPGFGRTFNSDRTPSTFVNFDDFRRVLSTWHSKLLRALEECLKSGDYMRIRNAINVLKAVATNFPKIDSMGRSLHQVVKDLSQTEPRDDLKLSAMSLLGDFRKSEKRWISEQEFRGASKIPITPNATSTANSEKPKPPQNQESPAPKLNATSNAFNPRTPNSNGTSNPSAKVTKEHEDGEVDDVKKQMAPIQPEFRAAAHSQNKYPDPRNHGTQQEARLTAGSGLHNSQSTATSGRLDSRMSSAHSTPASRVPHALPSKPDTQPSRPRTSDRPNDRLVEYPPRGRNDARNNPNTEFGRPGRDSPRDSFPDRRDPSPSRRARTRSPDRGPNPIDDRRNFRERDYSDRSMLPPRDARNPAGRGVVWGDHPRDMRDSRDMREHRDGRDMRERPDIRGPPLPPVDSRSRMHSGPSIVTDEKGYRREFPLNSHQNGDRASNLPPRPSVDRPPTKASAVSERSALVSDRPMINPERAAFINEDRSRNDNFRSDRDVRRDRVPSPRRGDERAPAAYHGRGDTSRDARLERTPPQLFQANRRDEPTTGSAPTGPRGGRSDAPSSARISREMFQPSQPSRPTTHQNQDPNYGRLNPPADTIPLGPRNLTSDPRDSQGHPPPPPPAAPAAAQPPGIHPSRLTNFRGASSIQTDVPGAPSGPRNSGRTPQGSTVSPASRGFPTGPASNERNTRGQDNRNPLRTINSVLTQNAPAGPDRPGDRNASNQNPIIRGRGANRAGGPTDEPSISSPMGSQSHPSTPNPFRAEGQHSRTDRIEHPLGRLENHSQDDGRVDSRGHREARRSERSGRNRSRSPDRSERRPDERSVRTGPEDRSTRSDEQERFGDRERGSGRDKRSSDRDGNRREKDREGDRSTRDGRDKRDRGGDSRARGGSDRKDDRDRRSGRDDGRDRKRGRGNEDPHGDTKRPRVSN